MATSWGSSWGTSWGNSWGPLPVADTTRFAGGSGAKHKRRRKRYEITREQVELWWTEYEALVRRDAPLEATEAISNAIKAVEASPEVPTKAEADNFSAALAQAAQARTEAIVAEAERAERAAQKIISHLERAERALIEMEDEDDALLLLLH